jgi:hypothetical protein
MRSLRPLIFTLALLLACNACLQDHEPLFRDREIDTILSGGGTEASWQLTTYSRDGEIQPLTDCRLNHQLFFSRVPVIFEKRDTAPRCPLSGGLLGQGEWSILQEEDFSNPILELLYEDGFEEAFRIFDISPLSFRLSRRVITGETEVREVYTYFKLEPEASSED